MVKKPVIIALLVAVLSSASPVRLSAQNDAWTCNQGPNDIVNAAQAAFDAGNLETAYLLGLEAGIWCVANHVRWLEARILVDRAERSLDLDDFDAMRPGMVDIGDTKLFLHCMGEGSPTVIFEHAMGSHSANWENVQPPLSTQTRVCRYDRRNQRYSAVYGTRLDRNAVRTAQDQVDDLVLLLATAGIEPPYILVGHAWGGILNLLFFLRHPDWVQGVVLVDACHPKQVERYNLVLDPDWEFPPHHAMNTERIDIIASMAQVAHIRSFEDRPLAVLTRGKEECTGCQALWNALQADYMTFSTNARRIIAEHSGHMIMDGEPELIVEAVMWVLNEVHADAGD